MGETCAMCGLELASIETRNLYHSGEALKASDYRGKCLRDITCWQRGYDREKARADAANSKLAATDVERLQALSALAAANARADQAESERDAASEVLRDALAWEAKTRGRLGLPQIDAPMWAQIARAALGDGAALNEDEQVKRLTAAMREADQHFERVGGSTRHHVRDCLLPVLEKHGLRLVAALAAPASAPGEET